MAFFRRRWVGPTLAALGALGCANLGDLPTGVCGNGVVEKGEDCDEPTTTASGASVCGQPGSASACRLLCNRDGSQACPQSWVCGIDGTCKLPKSPATWETGATPVAQGTAGQLLVADFDGDTIDDVAAVGSSTIDVHFFDKDRTSTDSWQIIASSPSASVGALTPAPIDGVTYGPSLVFNTDGVGVLTGQTDRTLTASNYASVSFKGVQKHVVPYYIDEGSAIDLPIDPTGFFVYDDSAIFAFIPSVNEANIPSVFGVDQVREGGARTAHFKDSVTCTQAAMALVTKADKQGHVRVYAPPCDMGVASMGGVQTIADVALPGGIGTCTSCQPLHLHDVDGDGHQDLLVAGEDDELYVAYSDGSGQFWPSLPPAPGSANTFGPFAALPNGPPLAVGDINGDCVIDVVDASTISLGVTAAKPACAAGAQPPASFVPIAGTTESQTWSVAAIGDVNGDARPDVVVASSSYAGITVYRGTGAELLNPAQIITSAPVKTLTLGDFDGDIVQDIAYAQAGDSTSSTTGDVTDSLFLAFGAKSGPLSDPVAFGDMPDVEQILPVYEHGVNTNLIQNPFVVSWSKAGDTDVYLFPGNSSRQMIAPYFLLENGIGSAPGPSVDVPRRSVVGSFTGRSGLADIAVFADCGDATMCERTLWLLPTLGGASILATDSADSPKPHATALSMKMNPDLAKAPDVLLGDLGPASGSAADQLVIVLPVASSTPGKFDTGITTTTVTNGAFAAPAAPQSIPGFDITAQSADKVEADLVMADVNGDGHLDVVLAAPRAASLAVVLWDPSKDALDVGSAWIWTTKDADGLGCGYARSSAPEATHATALPPSPKQQDVVAVRPEGAYVIHWNGTKLEASCHDDLGGGDAVAAGDLDGDGIPDLVMSERTGLTVYYGAAYAPGEAPTGQASTAGGAQ